MKMQGKYLIYLYFSMVFTTGYVLSIYLPFNIDSMKLTDENEEQLEVEHKRHPLNSQERYIHQQNRHRRSMAHPNCGKWSVPISRHTPTLTDKGDFELPTPAELEAFCPYSIGGQISDFQCSDEKLEPFKGTHDSPDGNVRIDCSDIHAGANCTVIVSLDVKCPDLSTQYKCSCGPPPVVTTTASTRIITTSSTVAPNLLGSSSDMRSVNVCGLSISWWIFVLIVSIILFLFNILLTVILYKKAVQQIRRQRNDKIQPMRMFQNNTNV